MNNSIKALIILLVAAAGLFFIYIIILAGIKSLNGEKEIHVFFSTAVIIIAGVLSTNLGAVLGVTLTPPKNAVSQTATFLSLRPSFQAQTVSTTETDPSQKFQIIACWVYAAGLFIAAIFYLIAINKSVSDAEMVPLLPELSKTLIGVFFGALTVALGRKT